MYLFSFLGKIFKQKNIFAIIYLLMNIFVIGLFATLLFETETYWYGLAIGSVFYLISLCVALSPVGEFVLRLQLGCRRLAKMPQYSNRMDPLIREVGMRALRMDTNMPDHLRFYVTSSTSPQAFTVGKRSICLSEGLLRLSDEEIKAALAHEFAHISNKDNELLLAISVGNFIVNGVIVAIRIVTIIIHLICALALTVAGERRAALATVVSEFFVLVFVNTLMWIWTQIGVLLVMKTSRENEFVADEFAYNLGYGKALCDLIVSTQTTPTSGLLASLKSAHPRSGKRIDHLRALGVQY